MKAAVLVASVALVALAAAGCGSADPCAHAVGACLAVHVDSAPDPEADTLEIDLLYGAVHDTTSVAADGGGKIVFPAVAGIDFPVLAASVDVALVIGARRNAAIGGTAVAAARLSPGQRAAIHVTLTGGPTGCVPGTVYCGGDKLTGASDTLYLCNAGHVPTVRAVCAGGCVARGGPDGCKGVGGTCIVPGLYCGGDKVTGDPQSLYECQPDGSGKLTMVCPTECVVSPPGKDDACR